MQGFSNTLHRLALCEKGAAALSATAGLIRSVVCIPFSIAQKKHARPVGGRGISAFLLFFLFHTGFSSYAEMRDGYAWVG